PPSYPRHLRPVCGYRRRVSLFWMLGSARAAGQRLGLRAARGGEARRERARLLRGRRRRRGHPARQRRGVRAAQAAPAGARRRRPGLDRDDGAGNRDRAAGRDRPARNAAAGPSRRRGGDGAGRGDRGHGHVPLVCRDLEWLAGYGLPVVVKGLLTAEDAKLACDHGAAAVVVSNHGGRQLDGVPATLDVLEEVVDAVDGRAEVLLDGGVRRGVDVLKGLALGARAVMIGRAMLWGLAVAGEE